MEEEMSMEDTVNNTEYVLNVLIDLLVEKGLITEKELDEKLEGDEEESEE